MNINLLSRCPSTSPFTFLSFGGFILLLLCLQLSCDFLQGKASAFYCLVFFFIHSFIHATCIEYFFPGGRHRGCRDDEIVYSIVEEQMRFKLSPLH